MTKIINLFGGPGCGKSTTRAGLFYTMRMAGKSVEELTEWVKEAIYEKRDIAFADQIFAFGNQEKSQNVLCGHSDYLITDSPLALSCVYGRNRTATFERLVIETFKGYNNINFFLQRPEGYTSKGRNESLDEAKRIDRQILDVLDKNDIEYVIIPTDGNTVDTIFDIIALMEKGDTIFEARDKLLYPNKPINQEIEEETIEPCPQCGNIGEIVQNYCIFYVRCDCCGYQVAGTSEKNAIKAWNNRQYIIKGR